MGGLRAPESLFQGAWTCPCMHTPDQWLPLLQEMIPFAVVGSDHEYQVNGKRILGRKTKWGTIEGTEGPRALA